MFFVFKLFPGNKDRFSVVSHPLVPPVIARFIRIKPQTWHSHISMRVEFYGCAKGKLTHRLYINYMCEIVILTKSIVPVKPKFSLLNSNFFFFIGAHRRVEVESGLLNTHQERSVFKKDNYFL